LKEEIDRFNAENPDYYRDLWEVLEDPGAIRRWLLDYQLHAEFDPKRRAPVSSSKAEMVYLNQSEDEEAFEEVLNASIDPLLSKTLLDSALLGEALQDIGAEPIRGQAMKRLLVEHGFHPIGKHRVASGDKQRRLWTQTPHLFRQGDEEGFDIEMIREWFAEASDPI